VVFPISPASRGLSESGGGPSAWPPFRPLPPAWCTRSATPLLSVKAFRQLLPSRFDDVEFRNNFNRLIGSKINRMDRLLDRFRMLSAASRQPMEAVNVMLPLDDTPSLLQPQLGGRDVALRQVTHGAL
jgi:signal transduction histidine kinase